MTLTTDRPRDVDERLAGHSDDGGHQGPGERRDTTAAARPRRTTVRLLAGLAALAAASMGASAIDVGGGTDEPAQPPAAVPAGVESAPANGGTELDVRGVPTWWSAGEPATRNEGVATPGRDSCGRPIVAGALRCE